jgi:hypothetical protein
MGDDLEAAMELAGYAVVTRQEFESLVADANATDAENARLREERDLFRDEAVPQAAEIMNAYAIKLRAAEKELDRLRAAVEQALNLGENEGMRDGKTPYPGWWVVLDRALDSRHHLDTAPDMGSTDVIHGWGVWHSEDREWIGFAATNGLAAEMVPDGPDYEHLFLRPAVAHIRRDFT